MLNQGMIRWKGRAPDRCPGYGWCRRVVASGTCVTEMPRTNGAGTAGAMMLAVVVLGTQAAAMSDVSNSNDRM